MSQDYDVFNIQLENEKITSADRRRKQREINDLRRLLKTPEGRRFIWKIISSCGIFRSSFTMNSNQTAFREGQREIGLNILNDVNEADSGAFAQMQQEYVSDINSKNESKQGGENAR